MCLLSSWSERPQREGTQSPMTPMAATFCCCYQCGPSSRLPASPQHVAAQPSGFASRIVARFGTSLGTSLAPSGENPESARESDSKLWSCNESGIGTSWILDHHQTLTWTKHLLYYLHWLCCNRTYVIKKNVPRTCLTPVLMVKRFYFGVLPNLREVERL